MFNQCSANVQPMFSQCSANVQPLGYKLVGPRDNQYRVRPGNEETDSAAGAAVVQQWCSSVAAVVKQ